MNMNVFITIHSCKSSCFATVFKRTKSVSWPVVCAVIVSENFATECVKGDLRNILTSNQNIVQ